MPQSVPALPPPEPDKPESPAATVQPLLLLRLSDDALTHVLIHLDVADIASAAASCRHLAVLASTDSLWRTLVITRWPLMVASTSSAGAASRDATTWRDVHRKRAELPRWRELCGRMDALEDVLACAATRGDAGGDAGGSDAAAADESRAWGERLSAHVLAIFSLAPEITRHDSPPGSPHSVRRAQYPPSLGAPPAAARARAGSTLEARAWVRRLTASLRSGAVLGMLCRMGEGLAAELEAYYEYPAPAETELRAGLLRALRGASALTLLRDELILREHKDDSRSPALELWMEHGLDAAVDEVASALRSLEMEGFHVAVPPTHRPAVPASHVWWRARPPLHSAGRIHYC